METTPDVTPDTPAEILFKLWPWLEANKNRLFFGGAAVIVVIGIYYFHSAQVASNEQAAGVALTQVMMTPPSGMTAADALKQVAAKFPGTAAAERAQLQAAAALFATSQYADAQALFQKFLESNPNSALAATAELGLGASQEAQGNLDAAESAYQIVATTYSSSTLSLSALCGLGRIEEAQGKLQQAMEHYSAAARAGISGSSLAEEAKMHAAEIQGKLAALAPKTAAPVSMAPVMTPVSVPPAK